MKEKVIKIFEKKGIFISEDELESLGEAIQETLEAIADKVEKDEPYATVAIARYREVASDIVNDITENN